MFPIFPPSRLNCPLRYPEVIKYCAFLPLIIALGRVVDLVKVSIVMVAVVAELGNVILSGSNKICIVTSSKSVIVAIFVIGAVKRILHLHQRPLLARLRVQSWRRGGVKRKRGRDTSSCYQDVDIIDIAGSDISGCVQCSLRVPRFETLM